MQSKTTTKRTLCEIEAIARRAVQRACPSDLMDVVSLTTDRTNGLIFIVLKCHELKKETKDEAGRNAEQGQTIGR